MPFEDFRWLAAVIAAHKNGEVVGRTRLQKTVWLLQRLGLPTEYSYMIHFYGPYSEGLHAEVGLLENLGIVEESPMMTRGGEPYFVAKVTQRKGLPVEQLDERVKKAIPVLESANSIVLELAATYDAFRDQGDSHDDAVQRVKRKKGSKCDNGNLEQALELLERLELKK
ncbi:MAG: hypothetical protein IT462_14625 [Planctomycetes bacterium]|nr:hypothetical protein [Planctomycetota bacterium]